MSTIHDTTSLRPYKNQTPPTMEGSLTPYVSGELQRVSASIAQCIVALKAIEARIVAGGL